MADTQRLQDALRAADAAGDTDAATKIAQALRDQGGSPSTPISPQNASDGALNDGPLKPSRFTQDMLGVGEGMFRASVEGPGQAVSAIAQAPFDMADAARTPSITDFMVPQKPSATILKDYNDAVKIRRADTEEAFQRHFGQPTSSVATGIGEFGTSVLMAPKGTVPEATTKIVSTLAQAVKQGAKAGALGGATSFQEGADTAASKALWTAGGGILGAAIGTIPAVGAGVQTAFRKYLTGPVVGDTASAVKDLYATMPEMQGKLNAAQETGNESIQKFLNRGAGAQAQEQLLSQTQALKENIDRIGRLYGPVLPPETAVAKGQLAMMNTRDAMVKTRNAIWNSDLDAIRTKVTADTFSQHGINGTAQVAVELPGLKEGFNQITRDFVNGSGESLTPGFQKIMAEYDALNGHLSFDSLEHLLRLTGGNSGSILKGGANETTQRAAGNQLKRVVFDAIDKADDQSEIGSMLKQLRAGYAARSKAIDDFEQGAAAKVLNVSSGDLVSNPEQALGNLYKLPDSELGKLSVVLKDASPEVLSSLRSSNVRQAYQEALVPNAKPGAPDFDLDKFLKATTGNGKLRGAGLYDAADQDILKKNISAMRVLLARTSQGANTPEVENTVMAGVSMAPAFIARSLFRLAGQGSVDKVLFDPTAYAKFKEVNSLLQSQQWMKAQFLLGTMIAKAQEQ